MPLHFFVIFHDRNKFYLCPDMKYIPFVLFAMLMFSCRADEQPVQNIDQIIHVYIKDRSGKDLLNKSITGSYQEVVLKDLGGIRDQMAMSGYNLRKDSDTLTYMEYIAGATRNLQDSLNPDYKTYRSDIMFQLRKTAADSVDLDTMVVFYEWTPELFQVKQINYNGAKVFTKTAGKANTFTVIK